MNRILAVETSSGCCSAALLEGGALTARMIETGREHSQLLLGMINELLEEASSGLNEVDAIALGCGPGSFTGVRIAAAVVQGLAYASENPVIPVSSLAVQAFGACRRHGAGPVLVAQDARMGQVYTAEFPDLNETLDAQEEVVNPSGMALPATKGWLATGSGWKAYQQQFPDALLQTVEHYDEYPFPLAEDLALLADRQFSKGKAVQAMQAIPNYVRNKVVQVPNK